MATKHNYAPYYWKYNNAADKFYNSGSAIALSCLCFVFFIIGSVSAIVSLASNEYSLLPLILAVIGILGVFLVSSMFYYGNAERHNKGDALVHNQYKALDGATKKKLRSLAKAYGRGKMNGEENRKFALLVKEKFNLSKDIPNRNKYLNTLDIELANVKQEKEIVLINKEAKKDIDNIMKEFK